MWCQHTQGDSAVGIAWQCDSYSRGRWESCDRPLGIISTLTCTALAGISTELQPWKLCCHMLSVFPCWEKRPPRRVHYFLRGSCYTEKASPTRHRPERQHNARPNHKQCSPNETKPYSKPTLPRKRQTTPTNGHTPRRWKPTHTQRIVSYKYLSVQLHSYHSCHGQLVGTSIDCAMRFMVLLQCCLNMKGIELD